ncbi:hypothetical protein [Bradyrhizobium cytisi]|uniref:Uncharacterized protein n=1 Tax=Bradyrhizobium cytisi TaxID=515489 RepID=A0A5S4WZE3_9BRAD|nr:hypothetical protein [Bradyrhizobium cytisi]TYL87460.1 hypothetical protein FXB38_04910 [Bradyrhizobium cytisi]
MKPLIHDAPNEAVITELYAYLSTDATGEGICAGMLGAFWTPLVTSKARVAESMRPLAAEIARASGKRVRLVKFTAREEVP